MNQVVDEANGENLAVATFPAQSIETRAEVRRISVLYEDGSTCEISKDSVQNLDDIAFEDNDDEMPPGDECGGDLEPVDDFDSELKSTYDEGMLGRGTLADLRRDCIRTALEHAAMLNSNSVSADFARTTDGIVEAARTFEYYIRGLDDASVKEVEDAVAPDDDRPDHSDVEHHEAMEFFKIGGKRPYPPHHGPGNDPYIMFEHGTELDHRTRYNGQVLKASTVGIDGSLPADAWDGPGIPPRPENEEV